EALLQLRGELLITGRTGDELQRRQRETMCRLQRVPLLLRQIPPGRGGARRLLERVPQTRSGKLQDLIHDGQEQGGLPVEVRVHGTLGEPGLAGGPAQARRMTPALGERRTGREDQGIAPLALPVPAGDGVGKLWHVSRIEPFEPLTYHQYPKTGSIHIPSESEELAWTPTL